jgi:hypothetical protein
MKDATMEFRMTPGWLDWHAGPSKPRFKLPAGAVDGTVMCSARVRSSIRAGAQVYAV